MDFSPKTSPAAPKFAGEAKAEKTIPNMVQRGAVYADPEPHFGYEGQGRIIDGTTVRVPG